ncbi:hypothetical protein FHU37_002695 [Allostreptomyces psammosilenae]|uniref:Uncharacterized protein n=1 Tax=Allostreptomyces psammosilenae TaxID=1892865 RepID=A0A853A5I2_9ACTN|nr:hypothetical protein [Allostreptomyces psammosilenae]
METGYQGDGPRPGSPFPMMAGNRRILFRAPGMYWSALGCPGNTLHSR